MSFVIAFISIMAVPWRGYIQIAIDVDYLLIPAMLYHLLMVVS
jgi:hypothetical protein